MYTFPDAVQALLKNIEPSLTANGFTAAIPADAVKGELPLFVEEGKKYLEYASEKGKIRIVFASTLISLLYTDVIPDEADLLDLKIASQSLFNLDEIEDRDIKSISNEFNDEITEFFGEKKQAKPHGKANVPVSKAQAKSGAMQYDANTLASRLTAPYPELKEPYKENLDKYGEFFGEEFFITYAPLIMDTIRKNDKQQMKKVFGIINDIYENGSSDVQGLIAVTILGEMDNDPALIENAKQYMSDELAEPVIYINKYFQTAAGKRKKEQLKNPPPYKPKKQKKQGFFSQMMAASAGQGGQNPPMMPM